MKMYWKYFVIFLSCLPNILADELACITEDVPKARIFDSLVHYQANKLSFNPHDPTYDGNYVSFSCNNIHILEKNIFVTFSSKYIIELDLSNKGIKKINEGALITLSCLFYLDLSNNLISNLTKEMFKDLINLKTLNISGNTLNHLYDNVFSNLKSIQILDCSRNNISDFEKYTLYDISTLKILMMSYNCIKRIRFLYFTKLINLKELYLDHNSLAMVPTTIFSKNVFLEKLDLSGNGLVLLDIKLDYPKLSSIKNLNLSDNYLITLHVDNILYHFPNPDLTIDFNNNQFYCSRWEEYLKEFKEKHIKIAPGRNFTHEYYIDGIACDTLNFSQNGTDSDEDTYIVQADLEEGGKRDEAIFHNKFDNIVKQLNKKEDELSHKRGKYKNVDLTADKSALVQHEESSASSYANKKDTDGSNSTVNGVTISLTVIGLVFLVLVTLDYVLGVGFMARTTRRVRRFLGISSEDESLEYLTLTQPT